MDIENGHRTVINRNEGQTAMTKGKGNWKICVKINKLYTNKIKWVYL